MTEFKVDDRVRDRYGEGTVRAVDTFSDGVLGCAVKFDRGEFATISASDLTLVPDTVMVPLSRKDAETIVAGTTPVSPGVYVWAPEAMLTMAQACRTALEKPAPTVRVEKGVTITDLGGGAELREYANGTKEWRLNGQRHRTDGPAIEWCEGDKSYYLNGKRMIEDEWKKGVGRWAN